MWWMVLLMVNASFAYNSDICYKPLVRTIFCLWYLLERTEDPFDCEPGWSALGSIVWIIVNNGSINSLMPPVRSGLS